MTRPRAAVRAAVLVAFVAGIAACSGGQAGSPVPSSPASTAASSLAPATATPTTSASSDASPNASPSVTPSETPVPTRTSSPGTPPQTPGLPPTASIGHVGGSLGSYTWDGVLADGPWIVPRSGVRATAGAALAVACGGGAAVTSWDASWAAVRNVTAGTPHAAGSGQGPVTIAAPAKAGTWSLRVTARFGEGREATWFWRVTVAP